VCAAGRSKSPDRHLDDIGFADLKLELGSALPDGGSIALT